MTLGIIGGTGLTTLPGLRILKSHAVDTPFGATSAPVEEGEYGGHPVFFLQRHGHAPAVRPPHRVNYRANIWALHALGVRRLIAVNAVGAIAPALQPGRLVIPDQLIDYSWGREHSFADGRDGTLQHIDFTHPYDATLREMLLRAASNAAVPCVDGAVLAVTQGPRLETAAEIQRLARDGCDVVGMTGMPEAALAREIGLAYVCVCMIVNAAAGLGEAVISLESIRAVLAQEVRLLADLLAAVIPAVAAS